MSQNTRLALAQYPITFHQHWDDWAAHIGRWVGDAARQGAALLVFPEYASMELVSLMPEVDQQDLARQIGQMEQFHAGFLSVFAHWAKQHSLLLLAPSLPVREGDKIVNRAYVFSPEGMVGYQDKWFMTRFENEDWQINSGAPQLRVFETDFCRLGIQTCYDVEFPIGSAQLCRQGVDLVLAPSCTETAHGATRVHVGARARALENQCFVGVSQVVGTAPWSLAVDINYGYGAVYGPPDKGFPPDGVLAQSAPQEQGWLIQDLDFSLLETVRREGAVLNARDHARIQYGW